MGLFNRDTNSTASSALTDDLPAGYDDDASDFYVHPDLRDDYVTATVSFGALQPYIKRRVEREADAAADDARPVGDNGLPIWAPMHGGDAEVAIQRARQRVIDAGPDSTDVAYAEHWLRLDHAISLKEERERVEAAERRREAARCRVCRALDVLTAAPVVRLMEPVAAPGMRTGFVAQLPGGPVCATCCVVVAQEYTASLAAAQIDNEGTTRADAARRYLAGG